MGDKEGKWVLLIESGYIIKTFIIRRAKGRISLFIISFRRLISMLVRDFLALVGRLFIRQSRR